MKKKGFTLLEVVLALSLASFLIAVCAIALNIYLKSIEKQKRLSQKTLKECVAVNILFKQLQNLPEKTFGKQTLIEGNPYTFRFVSFVSVTPSFPGIYGIEYSLENNTLSEREMPLIDKDDYETFKRGELNSKWHRLVKFEKSAEFRYFQNRLWLRECKNPCRAEYIGIKNDDEFYIILPISYFNTKLKR